MHVMGFVVGLNSSTVKRRLRENSSNVRWSLEKSLSYSKNVYRSTKLMQTEENWSVDNGTDVISWRKQNNSTSVNTQIGAQY